MAADRLDEDIDARTGGSDTVAPVFIVDVPSQRAHRVTDLLQLVGTALGIVAMLLLGAYASGTTSGITRDLRGLSDTITQVLVAPVNVLEGLVALVLPGVVILVLAIRREPRRIVEALGALLLGTIAVLAATAAARAWGSPGLVSSLSITRDGIEAVTMPALVGGMAAMMTAAGRRANRRSLAILWRVLWIAITVSVISGLVTLPAAAVTALVGRAVGLIMRYLLGSATDRAYGNALAEGIRRAGFEPRRLVRITRDTDPPTSKQTHDALSLAMADYRQARTYELTTTEGHRLYVAALDGDQAVAGLLSRWWRVLRLRGLDARADVSLRHTAESTALVSHAARAAGVLTPRVLGMSQARDSMILVYQRPTGVVPLNSLPDDKLTDAVIDAIWRQLAQLHASSITHRALTSGTILVGEEADNATPPQVWLTHWDLGEVASSALSRRLDRVQLLSLTAARIGAGRAIDAALRSIGSEGVAELGPLLQAIALPRTTRAEIRKRGRVLQDLRAELLAHLPDVDTQPEKISRFGPRTFVTLTIGIVAGWVLLSYVKAGEIIEATSHASPWWLLATFGWMLLTFIGGALALVAFAPVRMKFWQVVLGQIAASYVAIIMPAGVGPAAVNMRLLTRQGVTRPLAVATVAFVQVSGVITTVIGLVVLSLATGSDGALAQLPSGAVVIGVGAAAAVLALALTVAPLRAKLKAWAMPTLRQTGPRLLQMLGQPWRLALGIGGNLVLTVAFVGAFHATLRAFGQDLPLVDIAVLFLLGNAAGAVIPTPGGLGAVEGALTVGLAGAGLAAGVAGSVVVLYRATTYWARIPLGYLAMKILLKRGYL